MPSAAGVKEVFLAVADLPVASLNSTFTATVPFDDFLAVEILAVPAYLPSLVTIYTVFDAAFDQFEPETQLLGELLAAELPEPQNGQSSTTTVGTTTEIYDYLRLLYARAGKAYSYMTGEEMVKYTEEKVIDMILHDYQGKKIFILAPLVRSRKGHYRELFESMRRKGYLNIRVDGEIKEIVRGMKVDRYKNHDIEVVIDKLNLLPTSSKGEESSLGNPPMGGNGGGLTVRDLWRQKDLSPSELNCTIPLHGCRFLKVRL